MTSPSQCERCGAPLGDPGEGRHCPACLLEIGLAEPAGPDEPGLGGAEFGGPRGFGDYKLLGVIGRGGMGVVYKARQVSLNRLVALKMVQHSQDASPSTLMRFRLEAEAAAKLDHPNIVPTYQIGEENGQPFFSMKLIVGKSLARSFREFALAPPPGGGDRPLPARPGREAQVRIATLMATVAGAVHYAHQHGIIHRDLKPTNILIDAEGQPHLTDFGIAKVLEQASGLTHTNDLLGTPAYMAPEQASGKILSSAVDVYSLGAMLYELLTGQPPFLGKTPLETLRKAAEEEPVRPTTLNRSANEELGCIALKCLEKAPGQRYDSALALAEDLERWVRREPILARRAGAGVRTVRWVRRNPVGASLIASLCAGLVGTLVLLRMVNAEKDKTAAVLQEVELAGKTNARLLSLTVSMLHEQLEGLWLSNERRVLQISSEQLAALSGLPIVEVPKSASVERFRFGLSANESPVSDSRRYALLLAYLERRLSERRARPVRFDLHIFKFKEDRVEALVNGELDLARMGSYLLLQIRDEYPGVRALVVPEGSAKMGTFFTRAGTGIKTLADLKGRRLAFGDSVSGLTFKAQAKLADAGLSGRDLGGYVFLDSRSEFIEEVHELGYDAALKRRLWLHSTADVIEDVLEGRYDAGVTTRRGFEKHQHRGLVQIPGSEFERNPNPWVARDNLPADFAHDFVEVMTALQGEAFLLQLPDRPTGFRVVSESRDTERREVMRRIEGLFPTTAASRPQTTPSTNSVAPGR